MRAPVRSWRAAAVGAGLCAGAGVMSGCLERRIHITSDPAGALVHLNDVEVGRTPLEVDFEWYGTYDVRLQHEGYEPLSTSAKADAPVHEWPGIDLVAAALPVRFKNDVVWHFVLTPADDDPDAAIERARELRAVYLSRPDAEAEALPPAPRDAEGDGAEPEAAPE